MLITGVHELHAQTNPSKDGKFYVDYIKGCETLDVKIFDNITGAAYFLVTNGVRTGINYGQTPEGLEFKLARPGVYHIVQIADEITDSVKIQIFEPVLPKVKAYNCSNRRVYVEVDESIYDFYLLKNELGFPEVRLDNLNNYSTYLDFPTAGQQIITVEGKFDNTKGNDISCGSTSTNILVTDDLIPAEILEIQADMESDKVDFKFERQPNSFQVLEVQTGGTAAFTPLDTLEASEVSLDLEGVGRGMLCFRIATYNPCQSAQYYSATLCTPFFEANPGSGGNQISYQVPASPSPQEIRLLRDGQEIHRFASDPAGSFNDSDVSCKTFYDYALSLTYQNGTTVTKGLIIETRIDGELNAPENIISQWENNSPLYKIHFASQPPDASFFAYKNRHGSLTEIAGSADISLRVPFSGNGECPLFAYSDACNNKSAMSREVCPLFLKNTANTPNGLELEWNTFDGYLDGISSYKVEKLGSNGLLEQVVYQGNETYVNLGEQDLSESGSVYLVKAIPIDNSLEVSSSNLYDFQINTEPHFANIFSPNGDGKNDNFVPQGMYVKSCVLEIFNNWGEKVFRTVDKESGWDGTIRGQLAQQGNYIFQAVVVTEDGKTHTKKGTIYLLRK